MDTELKKSVDLEDQMPSEVKLTSFWQFLIREFKADKTALVSLIVLIAVLSTIFISAIYLDSTEIMRGMDLFNRDQAPTWWRWGNGPSETGGLLGTDAAGRSMVHMLIIGTQNSIRIGFTVSIISIVIGLVVGLFAGYYGGHFDNAVMRFLDMWAIIPSLMTMIVLRVMMTNFGVWHMIFLLTIFSWQGRARQIRNLTFGQRVQDYVEASRTLGTRNITIIFKKILPNLAAMVSADVILTLGTSIGIETGLTALGFGLPPGTPSIGFFISNALVSVNIQFRQWNWFPAIILVFIIMFSINFVGLAVSRAANAQQRLS